MGRGGREKYKKARKKREDGEGNHRIRRGNKSKRTIEKDIKKKRQSGRTKTSTKQNKRNKQK